VTDGLTAFAPGRVNLIGEHTDYNDGLALPFAIEQGVTVDAERSAGRRVEVHAVDLDAVDSFELAAPERVDGWRAFARGVTFELQREGSRLVGCRLRISGTVPRGSGLSSSAALEVALALAVLAVADSDLPEPVALARICSRVENEWVGARTGLLDQLASLCGQQGHAILVDFRSLDISPVQLDLGDHRLVTLDSGERHANADDDGYNTRRDECTRACELLGVASLRDATIEMTRSLPDPLAARARHVIGENDRVQRTVQALNDGDIAEVATLLNASHASLRDCFEVSTPEVERTVQCLLDAGALGARIVGGGFGGHVLGLLAPGATPPPGAVEVEAGPGAHLR
jgi:galactokinase